MFKEENEANKGRLFEHTTVSLPLVKYRLTPHSSTGVSLAELVFGRKLRLQMDLVKPDIGKEVRQAQDCQRKCDDAHAKYMSTIKSSSLNR